MPGLPSGGTSMATPEGLQELAKSKYRDVFNAFVLKVSAASKSKGIENDTWWRAGDSQAVGDALIRQMNAENGLRTQSWSDFTVKHLMDYIAATIELSTRGAKQHAYTKVLDYVDLMGRTGLMINMSLIPTRNYNGKLEYDPVEGIDYNGAMTMRNTYPDTAGTICIGITVDQIHQLLDSMDIDYVIPYHASGMSKDTRKLMHIPAWENFQDYQSEKKLSGSAARENARKYGVELLSESDPLWHEGPSFSEWFDLEKARATAKRVGKTGKYGVMTGGYAAMQEAAENYKRICAERGMAPKFSYGSKEFDADFSNDAGYWKLLIDRKMVNNKTGEIIEQRALKPTFDFDTVQRILDDELKRYPGVKADQENAILRVTRAFLKGDVKAGMSSDEIAKAIQTPVDNVPITNITQNATQMQKWDEVTQGLNFKDPTGELLDRVFNENKKYETRAYTDSARHGQLPKAYLNKPMGIIQTGAGKAKLVGFWELGDGVLRDSEWLEEHKAELGNDGTEFEAKAGEQKWVYPIKWAEKVEPMEVSSLGIQARDISDITKPEVQMQSWKTRRGLESLIGNLYNDSSLNPTTREEIESFNMQFQRKTRGMKEGQRRDFYIVTGSHYYPVTADGYLSGRINDSIPIDGNESYINDLIRRFDYGTDQRGRNARRPDERGRANAGRDSRNDAYAPVKGGTEGAAPLDVSEQGEHDLTETFAESYGYQSEEELIQAVESGALILFDDGTALGGDKTPPKTEQEQFYQRWDEGHNDWAPTFYSKMNRVVSEWTNGKGQKLPPKMAANQVVGWLRGKGVKAEEIRWSGIVPWLEGRKTVTQQELQAVMAGNEVKIETKVLGSSDKEIYTGRFD